ncbi:MAG: hypothetical protein ACI4AA_09290 [Lachnospiraceae bacterium]
MDNQLNNGFCPECGALLRDGVCPSCGFGNNNPQEETTEQTGNVNYTGTEQPETSQAAEPRHYETYQASMNNNADPNFNQNNGNPNYYQNNGNPNYYQNNGDPNAYYQNGYGQQQQNMYYQQPGANNYYGGQMPQEKKGKKGVVIAVIVGVVLCLLLLVVAMVMIFMSAKNAVSDSESDDIVYEDDYDTDIEEKEEDLFDEDDDWDSSDWEEDETFNYDEDLLAFVDDIDWEDTSWKEEPYNYSPEDVYDDYYECYISLCNCIDENVSYDMVYNNWEEIDRDQNVCIRVNYYQLEGDIPNLDVINEELRYQAGWAGDIYFDLADDFEEEFEEYGPGYVVSVESYVTYNDEETISVVSDIYYESATSVRKLLYGVNVDLTNGEIIKNAKMLDISDEFLEEYKEICEDQNGTVSIFDELDNDGLREFFEDRDDLIIYYTPCGLEVGINYDTDERYGWVTATLTDYEKYMR